MAISSPESYAAQLGGASTRSLNMFRAIHASFAGIEEMIAERPGQAEICRRLHEWAASLDVYLRTIRAYLKVMRPYLVDRRVLSPLCFPSIQLSDLTGSAYVPDAGELRELLTDCDARRRLMYIAVLSSGISPREAMGLHRKDVITGLERLVARIRRRN